MAPRPAVLLLTLAATLVAAGASTAADKKTNPETTAGSEAAAAHAGAAGIASRMAVDEPARFRVDMHLQQGGKNIVMRRYVDGPRTRMEMDADGQKMVMIELGDEKGTTYTLMPAEKRAMKMTRAAMDAVAGDLGAEPEAEPETNPAPPEGKVESLGTETIDGRQAEKLRVTYPNGSGLLWVDSATQLPLRMEGEGTTVELKDYDFGPQSPELFEVPKKYEVTDMDAMMAQMKDARGGRGGAGVGAMMPGGKGRMGMPSASGMAGGFAGNMGGQMGGQLGAGLGASVGGPVGAMIGQYVGQRIGQSVGQRVGQGAVKAVGAK